MKKGVQKEVFEFSNIIIFYFDFGWEPILYTTLLEKVLSSIMKFQSKSWLVTIINYKNYQIQSKNS